MTDAATLPDDLALVQRLRDGDEAAFIGLVERLQPTMLRITRMYVSTQAVAEEVVQDAWIGIPERARELRGAVRPPDLDPFRDGRR